MEKSYSNAIFQRHFGCIIENTKTESFTFVGKTKQEIRDTINFLFDLELKNRDKIKTLEKKLSVLEGKISLLKIQSQNEGEFNLVKAYTP